MKNERINQIITGKITDLEGRPPTPKQIQDWLNAVKSEEMTQEVVNLYLPKKEDIKEKGMV